MKTQHKSSSLLIGFLALTVLNTSCKKFIEIPLPVDQPTTTTVFSDDQTATSAINGLYSSMMIQNFSMFNSGITLYPALSADELYNTFPDANIAPFTNNALNSNSSIVDANFWKKCYNHIYQINAILNGLSNSTEISQTVKKQLSGETKFARALCYFYMINLFGDVPYIASTNYEENATVSRTLVSEIYQSIITDLQEAINLMSSDYPSSGKVRPNKWTATSLLARVYLYQKRWNEAEEAATMVINSGIYSLSPINSVFWGNSSEAIWQLLPVLTFLNTADGFTFIPFSTSVKPQYAVTDWLLSSFENNDQRKSSWLNSSTVNGQPYYYPFKYKIRSGNTVTEYNMMFRLAELYLIRSEARAMLNHISGSQDDLNIIRNRAGLPNTTANNETALLSAIEHERQIEFFAECGHRWFDLKRTGRINNVLGTIKTGWQTTDSLYPIPLSELQSNINLTQNAGY